MSYNKGTGTEEEWKDLKEAWKTDQEYTTVVEMQRVREEAGFISDIDVQW